MTSNTAKLAALALLASVLASGRGQKTKAELEADLAQTRAALAQLAQTEARSGASTPADCDAVLHSLLGSLSRLSDEGKRQASGLGQTVRETGAINLQADEEIRQAQNVNAGVAQAAVAKAASDARTTQLTQVLGFLSVMATMAFRMWTERQRHDETVTRIDALQKKTEGIV